MFQHSKPHILAVQDEVQVLGLLFPPQKFLEIFFGILAEVLCPLILAHMLIGGGEDVLEAFPRFGVPLILSSFLGVEFFHLSKTKYTR